MNHQTMNHFGLFFVCVCEIFPFIVLSFYLQVDCCYHWSASNWVFFFTQLSSFDFLNLCSSSSCVRTCSRQCWLLSAPESYLWRNIWVTSILRQLHILIIPYILFWTWQELYFQNFYLNLQYLSNRGFTLFLLLAVWLMVEGLQHFWDFSVVLLVALSAVLTVVKIYISIAVYQTTTELPTQGYTTLLCLNLVWTQRLISDDTL